MPCFHLVLLEELTMMKGSESLVICGRVETFDDVTAAVTALPAGVTHGLLVNVSRDDTPQIDEDIGCRVRTRIAKTGAKTCAKTGAKT